MLTIAPMPARPGRDKTGWAAYQPLPQTLPAAADVRHARYPVANRFTAGSFADGPRGASLRIATAESGIGRVVSLLAGRDLGAAIAAARKLAATELDVPAWEAWQGVSRKDETLVGLYQAASGAFMLTPLYSSPGTNDSINYFPVHMNKQATPDARFRFTDSGLAAVIGPDGMIVNPTYAQLFAPVAM